MKKKIYSKQAMNCEKNQDLINSSFFGPFGTSNILNNNNLDNLNISSIRINPNLSENTNKFNIDSINFNQNLSYKSKNNENPDTSIFGKIDYSKNSDKKKVKKDLSSIKSKKARDGKKIFNKKFVKRFSVNKKEINRNGF